MKNTTILFFIIIGLTAFSQKSNQLITIDTNQSTGELNPFWAWFGYDEPNYTYMKDGKKLLSELAELSPVPVYVRAHNLMTSGNGEAALKWGSTNMYTEDSMGNPVYNWLIIDSIFDTYIERGMKPLAQIGFMPEALSSNPDPYRHYWKPGDPYNTIITGWAYPPNNYEKWAELIFQWVKHSMERYGKAEVESWYWEVWNEPDGAYLNVKDPFSTYCKLYDYASDAVKRALPSGKIGGPHSTGGASWFLKKFLNHCLNDTNAATGRIGAALDFVGFHAKGRPKIVDNRVQMNMGAQLRNIRDNFKAIASIEEFKDLPVIIGESDPEGCAACGMSTNPENAYRNGTMYSSYTAASIPRIYDLANAYHINLIGAVNWSFEFEDQPWFFGFRDLATNGVDKPVLNVFRMLGKMTGERLKVNGNFQYDYSSIVSNSVQDKQTDLNAFASKSNKDICILIWNYHDDDVLDEGRTVQLKIDNLPFKKARLNHYRIDFFHSNSYETWKKMGSPQNPTSMEYKALEKAGKLETVEPAKKIKVKDNTYELEFEIPRQAVSLIQFQF